MALNTEQVIRYVRLTLGEDRGHGVTVEASDSQIVNGVRAALELYSRYRPIQSRQKFTAQVGGMVYTPTPKVRNILHLSMVPLAQGETFLPGTGLWGGAFLNTGAGYDYTAPRQYNNYLQWRSAADKVFSQEPGWLFIPEDNHLYITNPAGQVEVSFTGAIDFDFAFDEEVYEERPVDPYDEAPSKPEYGRLSAALAEVPINHHRWIRDLAVARTKETVGYQRRKFGVIPAAEGKDIQLDGGSMVDEGREAWETIKTEMADSAPGYEPIIG